MRRRTREEISRIWRPWLGTKALFFSSPKRNIGISNSIAGKPEIIAENTHHLRKKTKKKLEKYENISDPFKFKAAINAYGDVLVILLKIVRKRQSGRILSSCQSGLQSIQHSLFFQLAAYLLSIRLCRF